MFGHSILGSYDLVFVDTQGSPFNPIYTGLKPPVPIVYLNACGGPRPHRRHTFRGKWRQKVQLAILDIRLFQCRSRRKLQRTPSLAAVACTGLPVYGRHVITDAGVAARTRSVMLTFLYMA